MKKIYTLLATVCIGGFAFGQTVFQSNFENWTSSAPIVPTDFVGTKTNLSTDSITKVTTGAVYGNNTVQLQNGTTSGKRFSTQPVAVTNGTTYDITFWAKGNGQLGTRLWAGNYIGSVTYETINSSSWTMYTHQVTSDSTFSSAEFLFYVRQTSSNVEIDSVHIGTGTPPTPTIKKIYDIQYTTAPSGDSPELGNVVTTKGVVTGVVPYGSTEHSFFIQDSAKAWNGIFIFQNLDTTIMVGDSVEVTGTVDEYFNVTQIGFVSNVTVLNSGNGLPTPVANSTMGLNMEEWEGVLVNVVNAQCTDNTEGFGLWSLNDGSGVIKADDDLFPYAGTAIMGTNYDVTGIGHYSFNEFKILPRSINDISVSTGIEELTAAVGYTYPNPANSVLNFNLSVKNASVSIIDVTGKVVKTINTSNNITSVDVSGLTNGLYFYNVTSKGETILTDRFIIAK